MKQYVACDPGKDGSMAIIRPDGQIELHKYPKIGTEYDIDGMIEMFRQFRDTDCHIVIENVMALQKPMDAGNWSLSRGKTILEMCCIFFKLPFTMVHSKTWQKEIWEGIKPIEIPTNKKDKNGNVKYKVDTKATTLLAIKRLFPNVDLKRTQRCSTDDEGHSDALAMVEYGRRKF